MCMYIYIYIYIIYIYIYIVSFIGLPFRYHYHSFSLSTRCFQYTGFVFFTVKDAILSVIFRPGVIKLIATTG